MARPRNWQLMAQATVIITIVRCRTGPDAQAWWQVDLGASYQLDHINIWNRTDCCSERLSNFHALVSDAPFNSTDLIATLNQAGVSGYYVTGQTDIPSAVTTLRSGRYVRVQLTNTNYLALAEVEVFGQYASMPLPPPPPPSSPAYEGNHEGVDCNSIVGWVWDKTNPNTRLNVSVVDDTTGVLIASGVANVFRQDLLNAGKGDGAHGFIILTPTAIKDGQTHNVRVMVTGTNFSFSSRGFNSTTAGCSTPPPSDTVWVEDSIPTGATTVSNGWNWIGSNPSPLSGASSHQSTLMAGAQQHYFQGATSTLQVSVGDKLMTYVYLDPANPPSEIMLQWYEPSASWEHRAYWGANQITNLGVDGSNSRRFMGALPPTGQWVRLEVPAAAVGLEGRTLTGMGFANWGGRITWDHSGKSAQSWLPPPPPGDTVWIEDGLPIGANPIDDGDGWFWVSVKPTPASGGWAHQSNVVNGLHQHYFTRATATLTVNAGDKLIAYVYLDPQNPPSELMLQWDEGASTWAHRAYWGANSINYGIDGQPTRYYMGSLPAAGQWIRLEVPASLVGAEGSTINSMAFTLFGGRATWDRAGKKP